MCKLFSRIFFTTFSSVTLAGAVQEAYDIETGVRLNHKESEINVPLFPAGGRMIAVRIGKGEKSK